MDETFVESGFDTDIGGGAPAADGPSLDAPASDTPSVLPSAPVHEVVSVDELLDRLTAGSAEDNEADSAEQSGDVDEFGEPVESLSDQYYAYVLEDTTNKEILQTVTEILEEVKTHPAMTTDFADYSVSEGLLLLLLLSVFGSWLVRMVKGGLSWLLW